VLLSGGVGELGLGCCALVGASLELSGGKGEGLCELAWPPGGSLVLAMLGYGSSCSGASGVVLAGSLLDTPLAETLEGEVSGLVDVLLS
jgi:hypothetical protein